MKQLISALVFGVTANAALVTACLSRESNESVKSAVANKAKEQHYTKSTEPSRFDILARKVMQLYLEKTGDRTFKGKVRHTSLHAFDEVILRAARRPETRKIRPKMVKGNQIQADLAIDRYIVLSRLSRLKPANEEEAKLISEFRQGEINALSWLLNSLSTAKNIVQPEQLFADVEGEKIPVALRFFEPDYNRLYLFRDKSDDTKFKYNLRSKPIHVNGLAKIIGQYQGLVWGERTYFPAPVLPAEEVFRMGLDPDFYARLFFDYLVKSDIKRYPSLDEIPNHPEARRRAPREKKDPPEFLRAITTESEVINGFRVADRLSRRVNAGRLDPKGPQYLWRTYDFNVPEGKEKRVLENINNPRNVLFRPLGVGMGRYSDGGVISTDFAHDAGEWIGVLPNGLHTYALTVPVTRNISNRDAEDQRTEADPKIAPYKDIDAVTSPYHCMHCHRNGFLRIDNYNSDEIINLPHMKQAIADRYADPEAQPRIKAELEYILKSTETVQKVIQRDNIEFRAAKRKAFPYPKGYQASVDLIVPFYLMSTQPQKYLQFDGSPLKID